MKVTKKQPTSGSVFFLIFLAIGLFAAVSYAVLDGSRAGGASLTREQSRLAAQEIIAYGDSIANAVQTLRLRGCGDTELSFANDVFKNQAGVISTPEGHNPIAPASGQCDVFKPQGGNILARHVSPTGTKIYAPGPPPAYGAKGGLSAFSFISTGIGTPAHELFGVIGFIERSTCLEINELLGIENPGGEPPEETAPAGSANKYNGSYLQNYIIGDENLQLGSASAFCKSAAPTLNPKEYHYFKVLIAR